MWVQFRALDFVAVSSQTLATRCQIETQSEKKTRACTSARSFFWGSWISEQKDLFSFLFLNPSKKCETFQGKIASHTSNISCPTSWRPMCFVTEIEFHSKELVETHRSALYPPVVRPTTLKNSIRKIEIQHNLIRGKIAKYWNVEIMIQNVLSQSWIGCLLCKKANVYFWNIVHCLKIVTCVNRKLPLVQPDWFAT